MPSFELAALTSMRSSALTQQDATSLDQQDPLAPLQALFELPKNTIYLDGNSLGALPKTSKKRAAEVIEQQWGQDLITSWNAHQWIDLPTKVGERIAKLVGAGEGQLVCCDSISVNLFKLLCAALHLNPSRHQILSTADNFPTDLYMVQGLQNLIGEQKAHLVMADEQSIEQHLQAHGHQISVLLLTHVNFRSGAIFDMQAITALAHEKGVVVIWDLAHSAGILPVDLDACKVDFAVGCGYKYLNGGPGAPAFVYAASRHHKALQQPLSGWMGHASPFAFDNQYNKAPGIKQFLCGTPAVLSMSVLDAALDVFDDLDMQTLRMKSMLMTEYFASLVAQAPALADLCLLSPVNGQVRGSQLAYTHQHAYEICQALIAKGVIADFRAPNIIRFGFAPLYLSFEQLFQSVEILEQLMLKHTYLAPQYALRHAVT